MGKVKKFTALNIRKITGGKDPVRIVEEFILKLKFSPDEVLKEKTQEHTRWMLESGAEGDLEILVENIKKPNETTVYLGINVVTVPIRGANEMLAAALEIADGLVGIKVSLVGHYLVLSSTLGAIGMSLEELDYHYRLIIAQKDWFLTALSDELNLVTE